MLFHDIKHEIMYVLQFKYYYFATNTDIYQDSYLARLWGFN